MAFGFSNRALTTPVMDARMVPANPHMEKQAPLFYRIITKKVGW